MKPHHRIFFCFFIFAIALGALLSRMPDLQRKLGITESQLGLTLIGMAVGSIIAVTLVAPLVERLGARASALITITGTAAIYALIALVPNAIAAFALFFVAGLLAGALEINLNVQADRLSAEMGRSIMNRAHGMWSVGFFVTALAGAGIREARVPIEVHVGGLALLAIAASAVVISGMTDAPPRPGTEDDGEHRFAFPTLALLPLCLIGIAAFLIEGAGIDWSAIYMRDVFAVSPFVGGLGLTLFSFFMALSRLFADPVVDRFSARAVGTVLLLVAFVGLCLVWLAPHPYLALLGFALLGIGCSAVYPLALSAAALRTDRPASVNVAAVSQVSFVIFFLAPPSLGFVAEHLGIRNAYLACLPIVAIGLLCTPALGKGRGTKALTAGTGEPISPHG